MSKFLFLKMALINIKKNAKFYFPYFLTFVGTTMMFYNMCFLNFNTGIQSIPNAASLRSILNMGTWVIAIFAVIFLFYTNSFLMKRRQKELGLYNILGLEKKHIARVLFYETLLISAASIVGGLLTGILFSRLNLMVLNQLLNFDIKVRFEVSPEAILMTVAIFGMIFVLTLFSNLLRIGCARPIELLRGGNTGEREPKTKILLALIGTAFIGSGYYIAITTESPLDALGLFFVAVILVILGTYCLFTAGSIVILKLLRKNKKYYYKTKHFTTVSGMLYRMKQNAVGLANIAILSTMVLVLVSTTLCLYVGVQDELDTRFTNDFTLSLEYTPEDAPDTTDYLNQIQNIINTEGQSAKDMQNYEYLAFTVTRAGDKLYPDRDNYISSSKQHVLTVFTEQQYEKMTGRKLDLKKSEVVAYYEKEKLGKQFELFDKTYTVKEQVDEFPAESNYYMANIDFVVVSDAEVRDEMYEEQLTAYGDNASTLQYDVRFNLTGTEQEKIDCSKKMEELDGQIECKQAIKHQFFAMYGVMLFLGVFLGVLFLMATVLIIYYKQICEGYDDRERFVIMQQVGMSHKEVKQSINSQIMTVFFLPLITAGIHVAAAFPMIKRLLVLFNLSNTDLFIGTTIGTVLVFACIYGLVYMSTARVYLKIVNRN